MIQMIQSREYHILELSKHVEISDLQIKIKYKEIASYIRPSNCFL